MSPSPVLLVHGIWDGGRRFDTMREALERAGIGPTLAVDLLPNDGSGRIERLAEQVQAAARGLMARTRSRRLDVVGFSMGALVSRFWIQRLGGKRVTRRFVSISGPHNGTHTAWCLPGRGIRQMRPGSALLRELQSDVDPFGDVEVHSVWTPWDLMILPARSSRLERSHAEHTLPVSLHRFMITDRRAVATVRSILERD